MITIVRGGGQRVMIEIIISVNDENDGQSLILIYTSLLFFQLLIGYGADITATVKF